MLQECGYVITSVHNLCGQSEMFSTCERCTHLVSSDLLSASTTCAHGILLASLVPVFKDSTFLKHTQTHDFSDHFASWALVQSQKTERVMLLRKRGLVHTFLVIGDSEECVRDAVSSFAICVLVCLHQGPQLRCQNSRCRGKLKKKSVPTAKTQCMHLRALTSTKLYQDIVSDESDGEKKSCKEHW